MPKKSMTGGKSTKFSGDTPESKIEKAARHKKVGHGVLTEKEALFNAANAPSGTYTQEYFNATGDLVKFIGALIPLYITPEILDFEFISFVSEGANAYLLTELMSRGGAITADDKIKALSTNKAGRTRLAKYAEPSDIFIRDGSATPMLVKDYYLNPDGIGAQGRGIRASVTSTDKIRGLSVRPGGLAASGSGGPVTALKEALGVEKK